VRKLLFLINILYFILGMSYVSAEDLGEKVVFIVTKDDSVTVNLNLDFSDELSSVGFDKTPLIEQVGEDRVYPQVIIPVNNRYTATYELTEYTGELPDDVAAGEYLDLIVPGETHRLKYTIYVADFSVFCNNGNVTDNKVEKLYNEVNGKLQLSSEDLQYDVSQVVDGNELKWYYHSNQIGTGWNVEPKFFTGKNVFTLKVGNPDYSDVVTHLNGVPYDGYSEASHYMVLDNPIEYLQPGVGNYNFEIIYDEILDVDNCNIVDEGYSVSNQAFLADKPNFKLKLIFKDRSKENGENLNQLEYKWTAGSGSISPSSYGEVEGEFTNSYFSSQPNTIVLSVRSGGQELKKCKLTIHPYKPVMNFTSQVDMDAQKTLRISNVRDLRWQEVGNHEYSESNMGNYNQATGVLKLVPSALGSNKNPKMGYGVFIEVDTINKSISSPNNATILMKLKTQTGQPLKDMLNNGANIDQTFKKIEISTSSSGKLEGFLEKCTENSNGHEWSFMYYLPAKKDKNAGNYVEVWVDDIIFSYPNGEVNYSEWFYNDIHLFTYDNTIDVFDDIENYLIY